MYACAHVTSTTDTESSLTVMDSIANSELRARETFSYENERPTKTLKTDKTVGIYHIHMSRFYLFKRLLL